MQAPPDSKAPVVETVDVSKRFSRKADFILRAAMRCGLASPPQTVYALDRVSLALRHGEVLGLVGESGCGKSTLGRIICGLLPPSEGAVYVDGHNVSELDPKTRKKVDLSIQMVFQNPMFSLNPRKSIADSVFEAPRVHGMINGNAEDYVDEHLKLVGFDPSMKRRWPHQLSGGQLQRVNIARALAVRPKVLVCDESVAALDVSIQAQVLNLFMSLREHLGLTYLFISHDLGVVEHISDRVAIMYLGRIVEEAPGHEVFSHPNHPYTKALLAHVPRITTQKEIFKPIQGEIPSPLNPPSGCHFHLRCPFVMERCRKEAPMLRQIAPDHRSACHLNDKTEMDGSISGARVVTTT